MKIPKFVVSDQFKKSQVASPSTYEDVFIVLKDHRQACIRKHLRKLRKEREKLKKREEEKWVEEQERNRNEILNFNMLAEERLWQVLIEEKYEHNSETQQSGAEKVCKMEQVVELIQQLPNWPKKNLFENQFTEFKFMA